MKFALINNVKAEATKGATAVCPGCGTSLIAKCGETKVHHWAHKGVRNCDPWWENETAWHRAWKNHFPVNWQEYVAIDATTSEKHIADIRTDHGYVLEFQYSFLNPAERTARESFYKKMIWIVNGTRLSGDYPRFVKNKDQLRPGGKQGFLLIRFPEDCFPAAWLASKVPVIFDFMDLETTLTPDDPRHPLYLLYPATQSGDRVVAVIHRVSFINSVLDGSFFAQPEQPKQEPPKPPATRRTVLPQRPSHFIYDRGRLKRRQRW